MLPLPCYDTVSGRKFNSLHLELSGPPQIREKVLTQEKGKQYATISVLPSPVAQVKEKELHISLALFSF